MQRDLDTVTRQVRSSLSVSASSPEVIRRARTKNQKKRAKKSATKKKQQKQKQQQPPAPPPPSPEELAERARHERETKQQNDPAWQNKIQEMSRPTIAPHDWSGPARQPTDGSDPDPNVRGLPAKLERRRERVLGPMLEKHSKTIDERNAAEAERQAAEAERRAAEQKELDDAPFRTPEAQQVLADKRAAVSERVTTATADAKVVGLPITALVALRRKANAARSAESWYEHDELLDELDAEAQKMISYAHGLRTTDDRISALPGHLQTKKYDLRQIFLTFRRMASAPNRDDDQVSAELQRLLDGIQELEDAELAKSNARSASAAEAARRANLRAAGRWPGNDNPAAEIATADRASVGGSDDERAAVVEALDALKDPSLDHSWARKWGERHGNGEGNLPGIPGGGGYLEYYVRPPGSAVGTPGRTSAGPRRLVVHTPSGRVYYSHNHYGDPRGTSLPAFVLVTDA